MRAEDNIGVAAQQVQLAIGDGLAHAVVVADAGLVLDDVQPRAADLAAFQPGHQRVRVDEGAACRVDQQHAVLHLGDGVGVDEVVVLRRSVRVQRDDVAAGIQLVQRDIVCVFLYSVVRVEVVGQHLAAETAQIANDGLADLASANDAHCAVRDIAAHLAGQ